MALYVLSDVPLINFSLTHSLTYLLILILFDSSMLRLITGRNPSDKLRAWYHQHCCSNTICSHFCTSQSYLSFCSIFMLLRDLLPFPTYPSPSHNLPFPPTRPNLSHPVLSCSICRVFILVSTGTRSVKPCPQCRRKVRLLQKSATVQQSHFSATVWTGLKRSRKSQWRRQDLVRGMKLRGNYLRVTHTQNITKFMQ